MSNLDKLKECLKCDLKDYKSIPFWSWNNELDQEELIKQIYDMKEAGMGGFIIHARTGLKTEYLGEKWFSCVKACLDKAKELNMNAWIYDENGWPSGFVGGKLLENVDYRARYLEYQVLNYFDEKAFCVYKEENGKYIRINQNCICDKYHSIYLKISPANTDILNIDVVNEFIKMTHEEYYKRFSDSFGKELVGFFTDEPQFYRYSTPYSKSVYSEIDEKEVLDNLIYLFINNEAGYRFRLKYYKALNKLYVNNFYKKIYDWCEQHNCKLTGHSIEEGALYAQMYGGGNVTTSYEYEHIPGVDWLGRDCGNELAAKQVSSICAQTGKKQILTETFACGGYDTTPEELKSIGDFQYFNGVNLMCHHLFPYSLSGQGKFDHPPVFSRHNNWFTESKVFNEYFDRLGYIIANTKEIYDVGIIHPIQNVYLDYIREKDYLSVKKLEDDFRELIVYLRKHGIMFQFIDEEILKKHGKVNGEKLVVGKCEYKTIIVPKMKSLDSNTYNLLKEFKGNLLLTDKILYIDGNREDVDLISNITFDDVINNRLIDFNCSDGLSFMTSRESELGKFIFIKNLSRKEDSVVNINGISDKYVLLDLNTFKTSNISNNITLKKNKGIILLKEEDIKQKQINEYKNIDITDEFQIRSISDNYLVLDYGYLSYDGINYFEKEPLQSIFDKLLRNSYKGIIYIKQFVKTNDYINLKLVMEKDSFDKVCINNNEITFKKSDFDFNFYESDITRFMSPGINEIVYSLDFYEHDGVHFALFDPLATESVRNCLYYDKSIETGYLKGRFIVNDDYSLSKLKVFPKITEDINNNGYPFFMGDVYLYAQFNYDKNDDDFVYLKIDGRYQVCNVVINGMNINYVLDNTYDITDYLNSGKNIIKVYVKSSLRNLFGPHHVKGVKEPTGVHPGLFTFRTLWNDGVASGYTDLYNSVNFGIKSINLIYKKTDYVV